MTDRTAYRPRPVTIGGIGGSGTRLGAAFLQILGYYIGGDLNESLDNLWFTLLFKRRSILTESNREFDALASLFFARMSGETGFTGEQGERISSLAQHGRLQHPQEWLCQRAESFLNGAYSRHPEQPWGWKEPNTHIVIDELLEIKRDLRYIHFTRHPLDMALSSNQNQLEIWGPVFLDREVTIEPRASLAYWCAAHRRFNLVMQRWPERIMIVDFDQLCADPRTFGEQVIDFLDVTAPEHFDSKLNALIDRNRHSSGRFKKADLRQFAPEDLSYVRQLGYVV